MTNNEHKVRAGRFVIRTFGFLSSIVIRASSFVSEQLKLSFSLPRMDQTLFHLINERWTNPVLDLFMAAMSNAAIWRPLILLTIVLVLLLGGFKARACLICIFLSLLMAEQFTGLLKHAFDRRRPKQVQSVRMVELPQTSPAFLTLFKKPAIRYSGQADRNSSGPSLPSGHMTNNTVIALCLTLFYGRRGALYWTLAAAIGWSRIYLGAHWPSDILATFFLAAGEALLILALFELLWRRLAPRFAPAIYERHPGLIENVGQASSLPSKNSQAGGSRDS
jgi:undecaprenyl-diphosphatase